MVASRRLPFPYLGSAGHPNPPRERQCARSVSLFEGSIGEGEEKGGEGVGRVAEGGGGGGQGLRASRDMVENGQETVGIISVT